MEVKDLDFSKDSIVTLGTQIGQWEALQGLCEFIGREMNVPMESYDTVKASDPTTPPTFMYLLGPQYEICLLAHGHRFSRDFDPGQWAFNPVTVGAQIREAITSMQDEYQAMTLPLHHN